MKIRIKRIDKSLPLPRYATEGAVGFDLITREAVTIAPRDIALIPANVIVEVPKGYALLIVSRSSTPRKHGLIKPHSIGVIDQDYCGENDEIKIQVFNITEEPVTLPKGSRIAQAILVRTDQAEFEEVDSMHPQSRGGFGSTG